MKRKVYLEELEGNLDGRRQLRRVEFEVADHLETAFEGLLGNATGRASPQKASAFDTARERGTAIIRSDMIGDEAVREASLQDTSRVINGLPFKLIAVSLQDLPTVSSKQEKQERQTGAHTLTPEEAAVDIAEIPLPSDDLIASWDDQPATQSKAEPQKADAAPAPEVASLDYVDGAPGQTIKLDHPFNFDGRRIEEIIVSPLTTMEMGALVERQATADFFEFYGAMAGLPASVIRALRGNDGDRVTEACYGFLPRFMKGGA